MDMAHPLPDTVRSLRRDGLTEDQIRRALSPAIETNPAYRKWAAENLDRPPLVMGGQGRTAEDVGRSGMAIVWAVVAAAAALVALKVFF